MSGKARRLKLDRRYNREVAKQIAQQREADFGKVVVKLHMKLGMGREAIYELLGGLVTKPEIKLWCDKAKQKADKLRSKKKSNDRPASNP